MHAITTAVWIDKRWVKRLQHKSRARFKDSFDKSLTDFKTSHDNGERCASDRLKWKKDIYDGAKLFEENRRRRAKVKRATRKALPMDDDFTFWNLPTNLYFLL